MKRPKKWGDHLNACCSLTDKIVVRATVGILVLEEIDLRCPPQIPYFSGDRRKVDQDQTLITGGS